MSMIVSMMLNYVNLMPFYCHSVGMAMIYVCTRYHGHVHYNPDVMVIRVQCVQHTEY